jgi:hypothetical protein
MSDGDGGGYLVLVAIAIRTSSHGNVTLERTQLYLKQEL